VPPRLMAGARRSSREHGKSDPIDALAVARAAVREPNLPVAQLDGEQRRLRLLVDHRDDLVAERTPIQCRLRWHLHELMPEFKVPPKAFRRLCWHREVEGRLDALESTVAAIAREVVVRSRELTLRAQELEREITALVRVPGAGLLAIAGGGVLTAAKIIGETAGASRFHSKAAFARWTGSPPIPVWSSNTARHRLSRGGNRQVNAALHRTAVTQWRGIGPGRDYMSDASRSGTPRPRRSGRSAVDCRTWSFACSWQRNAHGSCQALRSCALRLDIAVPISATGRRAGMKMVLRLARDAGGCLALEAVDTVWRGADQKGHTLCHEHV